MIVAAVIVTRNRPESLSAALEAVLGQTRRPDLTLVVTTATGRR
jgi:GT2 family glycosyltransferase